MIITIDGPTASGKSTMGKLLAERLSFQYLNSGALYRALGYLLLERKGYTLEQLAVPCVEDIAFYFAPNILRYIYDAQEEKVLFDDQDIWPQLKSSVIDQAASIVSTNPAVRQALLDFQRTFAQNHEVIVDGRDCGSVVFPYADVKFFLRAGIEERALRWQSAQGEHGAHFELLQATQKVAARDARDMSRAVAPLVVPAGAITIDNSKMTIEQTLDFMLRIIEKKRESLNKEKYAFDDLMF